MPVRKQTTFYPWKTNIITIVFWIGERSSRQNAWATSSLIDNGAGGAEDEMSGYGSSQHSFTLNPFYIALPFNDLAYPEKAKIWVPTSWATPPQKEKSVSACKDRWIEIRVPSGRTCYAQWEDIGPVSSDRAEYVFGPNRPTPGLMYRPQLPFIWESIGVVRRSLHGASSMMTPWNLACGKNNEQPINLGVGKSHIFNKPTSGTRTLL